MRSAMFDVTSPPIDRRDLEAATAPLGYSRTLPAVLYTSPELFQWEQECFFEDSWFCVGRATDVTGPGDQKAVTIGAEGVLLVRDDTGELHGFYNVCRHRGHELLGAGECVRRRTIQCPYHAWIYNLDGSLKGAPRFGDVPGFDKREHSLIPVRVAEWNGWIFVNASGNAPDFMAHCGDLDRLLGAYECARLSVGARHDYIVEANWKVITENYHECYHCSNIHPELCEVTPPDSGVDDDPDGAWVGGSMFLRTHAQTMSLSGESFAPPLSGLDESQRRQVLYYSLWPNLLISAHPDYVLTHRLEPLDAGRTRVECEWLWPPEVLAENGFDGSYATEFWDITNRQDWRACESVQRGMASRGFRPGPLSVQEGTTHKFVSMVARSYLDGRVSYPPLRTAT
jgi:glycine betaine catabolism A